MKRFAIIGGGIAGLATAYFLNQRGAGSVDYKLIESEPHFGGKIISAREKGFVVEGGPDSFLTTKPAAINLCRELGLDDQLIGTNDAGRKIYVWSRGQLRQMPDGVMLIIPTRVMPFVTSPLISWPGKLRMGMDMFIPPRRDDGDESLAHFVRRRLGEEALDRIAEPMIAGIYVADAEYLSLKSTFPRFLDMERKYGGLLKGVIAQKRANHNSQSNGKPAISMFMTLRGGLQDMVDGILSRLNPNSLLPGRRVIQVTRRENGYGIVLSDGACLEADAVVFASPTYATADLVQGFDTALADSLRGIRYVSTATVSLGYKRSELTHPLKGFGFVVPRSEKRKILACTWTSTKFNYRAADDYALVRAFIGGAHAEHLAEEGDEALAAMAREELRAMMGIATEPVLTKVYRWPKANPQYAVGHAQRIIEIEKQAARHAGLYLAGGAYHGVGIPDCIEDGAKVTEQIVNG
jgi:oxygen-dependent protoporphyrinogen oxidase